MELCCSAVGIKQKRLHLTAAQQLVQAQEVDGHFEPRILANKLIRLWDLRVPFGTAPNNGVPSAIVQELSVTRVDSTYFVLRLFERLCAKVTAHDPGKVTEEQLCKWFGEVGVLDERWFVEAVGWIERACQEMKTTIDSSLRDRIDALGDAWFETDTNDLRLPSFVSAEKREQKKVELLKKTKAQDMATAAEAVRWERLWSNTPSMPIDCLMHVPLAWQHVSAVRAAGGGSMSTFVVRISSCRNVSSSTQDVSSNIDTLDEMRHEIAHEKFLIKGCNDEGDVVAHELARLLGKFRVASLRFVSPISPEFQLMEKIFSGAARSANGAELEGYASLQVEENALSQARPEMQVEFSSIRDRQLLLVMLERLKFQGLPLMVMEFIEGEFSLQNSQLGSDTLLKGEERFFRNLGHVVAYDLLLNNWDRVPALSTWPSAGNLGNILVQLEEKPRDGSATLVAIDQACMMLCEPQKRVEYYSALRAFIEEIGHDDSNGSRAPLDRIWSCIEKQVMRYTGDARKDTANFEKFIVKPDPAQGVQIDDDARCFFRAGMFEDVLCSAHMAKLRKEISLERNSLLENWKEYFHANWESIHAQRLEGMLSFVEECTCVVESHVLYEQIVNRSLEKNVSYPTNKYFSYQTALGRLQTREAGQ